ncbi:hypothetical protein DBV05_g4370 [Lasiodiplodia theobromae]|uniref:Uncharacterized protein n=1 Tax=Lasiodiplodia theobromae TaxID=45133 RepID=A0A5N5DJB1_9PEZI|nr:hypothetical protein DBV05_g4370 [Lasiodiplodia theobromae]
MATVLSLLYPGSVDRNFALRFTIDPARQYLIVNDQQRIALRNGNIAERFSAAIPIFVPVGNLAPSSSTSSTFSLSRILPPSFFPFPFPPWFHAADATLLSWWLAPSTAVVNLRASWSGATDEEGFGGPMEIWPDDESWYDGSDGDVEKRQPPGPPRGTRPLLTVTVVRSQIPNNDIIVSAPPLSVSPTATLAFRRAAFAWLFPAWFLGARLRAKVVA